MSERPEARLSRPEGRHRPTTIEGVQRARPRQGMLGVALVVVGGLASAGGAALPWVTATLTAEGATVEESATGLTAGDGQVTLAAAGLGLVLVAGGWWLGRSVGVRRTLFALALLPSLAITGVGVFDALTVGNKADEFRRLLAEVVREGTEFTFDAAVGNGLWLSIIGGVVMTVGIVLLLAGPGRPPSPPPAQPGWGRTGG